MVGKTKSYGTKKITGCGMWVLKRVDDFLPKYRLFTANYASSILSKVPLLSKKKRARPCHTFSIPAFHQFTANFMLDILFEDACRLEVPRGRILAISFCLFRITLTFKNSHFSCCISDTSFIWKKEKTSTWKEKGYFWQLKKSSSIF